jgi:hypothetical protein
MFNLCVDWPNSSDENVEISLWHKSTVVNSVTLPNKNFDCRSVIPVFEQLTSFSVILQRHKLSQTSATILYIKQYRIKICDNAVSIVLSVSKYRRFQ